MENAKGGKIQFIFKIAPAQVNLFAKAGIEMAVMRQALHIFPQ